MGNLGMYQEIVEDAKRAGGVEALIKIIEDNAAANAFRKGTAAGVLITAGMAAGGFALHHFLNRKALDREALGAAAQDALRSASTLGTSTEQDNRESSPATDSRLCSWCGEPGHGSRACPEPDDAVLCAVCGYHGHEGRHCSRTKGQAE